MPLSHPRLVVVLAALAVGLLGTGATAQTQDDGPRNPAAEAATGDTDAMLAVVQDIVDCLRSKGFHPGEPRVEGGTNVVITDWNPAWNSPAARADRECGFPAR